MIRFKSRRFNDLDRPLLIHLHELTNHPARGDLNDQGQPSNGSVLRRRLDERLMGEQFPNDCWALIANKWFYPAGWTLVTRHLHGPDGEPLSAPTASAHFYVSPKFRRTGLGTRLVQEACELSRKNGIQRLLVNPWNASSLSFYRANGFELLEDYTDSWCRGIAAKDLRAA